MAVLITPETSILLKEAKSEEIVQLLPIMIELFPFKIILLLSFAPNLIKPLSVREKVG
jgi:hypothetical protein